MNDIFPVIKTSKLREPHVYFKYSLLLPLLKSSPGNFWKYFFLDCEERQTGRPCKLLLLLLFCLLPSQTKVHGSRSQNPPVDLFVFKDTSTSSLVMHCCSYLSIRNYIGPFKKLSFLDPVQCLYWEPGMDKECRVGLGPGTFIDAFHKVPQVFLT